MARIELSGVDVRYPIYSTGRQRSILGFAANRMSFGKIARDSGNIPVVSALENVSFQLRDGDRLALVGRNGSGKTSLLKLCAGLLVPSAGTIAVDGSRASILNAGSGFDPDKTGFENVEFVSVLLGVAAGERKALLEDVAEFTELGDFLNLPVRTYSAGMQVRLMFALATSVPRDILIIDEVIAAGDALFIEKAAARTRALANRAKILVLATHSGEIATQLCNRAIWMDSGRALMSGSPDAVWDAYIHERRPHVAAAAA